MTDNEIEFYKGIGSNLKKLREARNLSREYVAEAMGMSVDSIKKFENGERRIHGELILRAALLLDCSIISIFRGLDPRSEPDTNQAEYHVLTPGDSAIFRHIASDWDGDVHALVQLNGTYAALPRHRRRHIAMEATIQVSDALSAGEITEDDLPYDYHYMENATGGMY